MNSELITVRFFTRLVGPWRDSPNASLTMATHDKALAPGRGRWGWM